MEKEKKKALKGLLNHALEDATTLAAAYWIFLIILKIIGKVDGNWPEALISIVWIWPAAALSYAVVISFIVLKVWIGIRRRRRKIDRRIIRQAKAAGVWDDPGVLGGRALELKARKDYKLKRKPGETDPELRRRYIAEIEREAEEMEK